MQDDIDMHHTKSSPNSSVSSLASRDIDYNKNNDDNEHNSYNESGNHSSDNENGNVFQSFGDDEGRDLIRRQNPTRTTVPMSARGTTRARTKVGDLAYTFGPAYPAETSEFSLPSDNRFGPQIDSIDFSSTSMIPANISPPQSLTLFLCRFIGSLASVTNCPFHGQDSEDHFGGPKC